MERPTIKIPAPVAYPGERVKALNDCKYGPIWETGHCSEAQYKITHATSTMAGHWLYRVILDRQGMSGDAICLYVGDDGIITADQRRRIVVLPDAVQ